MEKKYDYKNFNDLTDDKIFNINLSWMYNPQLYNEISQDVVSKYNKYKHSNELKSIQTFLDNITNEHIKNKQDTLEEFKTVKNNVKSENLKDIAKELKYAIFGYDYDDDNEEPKYEESIAERTKMRRQNKETDKKMHRELLPHQILTAMIQINLQKCIIHLIVRLLMMKRLKKAMIKKVMMVLGMTSGGLIKLGLIKMGMTSGGLKAVFHKFYLIHSMTISLQIF